jgi:hypothetical protein
MKKPIPTPYTLLHERIADLKFDKRQQELAIADAARSIMDSLHPAQLAKDSILELSEDREVQVTTTQTALKMGTRFLVYKVLGRFGGVFGAVAAAVAGNLSDKYMNRAAPGLLNVIGSLFKNKEEKEDHIPIAEVY